MDWIFRGQGTQGIGQGDGGRVSRGEQFLAASAAVARDKVTLKAIRPWMTLDARDGDHRTLDHQLEAWSYVVLDGRAVVVRMVSNPLFQKYDRRAAYFSQAWLGAPGQDTVLSLGQPNDFNAAGDPDAAPVPDSMLEIRTGAPQGHGERVLPVAQRFLAHFLDAIAAQATVVIPAPLESFRQGSELSLAMGLATAALPAPYRQHFPVRCFTRNPRLFASARAVAVPEDALSDTAEAYRHRIILAPDGNVVRGSPPSEVASVYASIAMQSARVMPAAMLRLSVDAGRHVRPEQAIPKRLVEVAHVVSFLSYTATLPPRTGDTFQQLVPQITGKTAIPLVDLIRAEAWDRTSDRDLLWVLTTPDLPDMEPNRSATNDLEHLRVACLERASRRSLTIGASALPRAHRRLDHAAWLAVGGLMDHAELAKISVDVATSDLPAGDGLVQVLRAEAEQADASGIRWTRADDPRALAQKLAVAPNVLEDAVRWSDSGALGSAWLGEFAELAGQPARLELAQQLFSTMSARTGRPSASLLARASTVAGRMVRERDPIPPPVLEAAIRLIRVLPDDSPAGLIIDLNELCARAGVRGATGRASLPGWILNAEDREAARAVVSAALDPERVALAPTDVIESDSVIFPKWNSHVLDLIVGAWDRFEPGSPRTAVALLDAAVRTPQAPGAVGIKSRLATSITASLNDGSGETWRATADSLVRFGLWLPFTTNEDLSQLGRRNLAIGWLGSPSARTRATPPSIEAWEWIQSELGRHPHEGPGVKRTGLTAGDVRAILADGRPQWCWIPRFERSQIRDLCELAADLETLALLVDAIVLDTQRPQDGSLIDQHNDRSAESLARQFVEKAVIQWAGNAPGGKSSWSLLRPTGIAVLLNDHPRPGERLIAEDLATLYAGAGAAVPRIGPRLTLWLDGDALRDPGSIARLLRIGREHGAWEDPHFFSHVLKWFRANPFVENTELLRALDQKLEGLPTPSWRQPATDQAKRAGDHLLTRHGFRNLAALIDRSLVASRISYFDYSAFPEGLARYLILGGKQPDLDAACAALNERAAACKTPVQPVSELALRLVELKEHLDSTTRVAMERSGPNRWLNILHALPNLCNYDAGTGVVPALQVLIFLTGPEEQASVAEAFLGRALAERALGRGPLEPWNGYFDSLQWWTAIYNTTRKFASRPDHATAAEHFILRTAQKPRYRLKMIRIHHAFSPPPKPRPPRRKPA